MIKFYLGKYTKQVNSEFNRALNEKVIERIWQKDHTVWKDDPEEISNRLGWLNSPKSSLSELSQIEDFANEIRSEGFENILLLGMGGSSLAPEVFSFIFGDEDKGIDLSVLDSTDPEAVLAVKEKLSGKKTLYIVSTKSGGTVETISFMKYFYTQVSESAGRNEAGNYFAAITDPGSGLEQMAKDLNFRKIFLNDPNIGGRYSVLSLFGCVPAALTGVDLNKFLNSAVSGVENSKLTSDENFAAFLGSAIGSLAKAGVDKLTFVMSDQIKYFGAWIEQLVAESTGKEGKGILPVDLESTFEPDNYSKDRVFVYTHFENDDSKNSFIENLKEAGFPVIEILLKDRYDLGREFFNWEFATAIAGWSLDIQPFDQPNVESAKIQARKFVKSYHDTGKLPELQPLFEEDKIKFYGNLESRTTTGLFTEFMEVLMPGKDNFAGRSYLSLQAYLKPSETMTELFQELRDAIARKYKIAATFGYGPRFLHSTGQLHKGDGGNGLFIQFISEKSEDADIPDEAGFQKSSMTFGVLISAQALGDRQALIENHRNILTLNLGDYAEENLTKLIEKIC